MLATAPWPQLGGTLASPESKKKARRAGQARRAEGCRPADVGEEEGASWGRSDERSGASLGLVQFRGRGTTSMLPPGRVVMDTARRCTKVWAAAPPLSLPLHALASPRVPRSR